MLHCDVQRVALTTSRSRRWIVVTKQRNGTVDLMMALNRYVCSKKPSPMLLTVMCFCVCGNGV